MPDQGRAGPNRPPPQETSTPGEPLKSSILSVLALGLTSGVAFAQDASTPQPLPMPAPIAAPKDTPYPGVIRLEVDAADTDRRIFRVRETVPVAQAGKLTLLYPMWLPGSHASRGALDKLAGLEINAGGKRLEWTRDPIEPAAFHVEVPQGVAALDVEFQFVSPTDGPQGRIVVTPEMLNLQWNAVALYPAGYFTRQIQVEPSVRLPQGWGFGTALEAAGPAKDGVVRFKATPFDTLVDSPMFAGRYYKQIDLDPGGRSPVRLNIVADSPELLEARPDQIEAHRRLIQQADKLYGARHYDHYDFLLALTDRMGGIGLEHHRSSENGTAPTYFTEWSKLAAARDLLPHEYTHSWNGKFRRPADLWTANFNTPMRGSLLWVYEGQTQYWGYVLAARSGLLSKQEALDAIASTAATYDNRVGREWRAMQDTVNDPIIAARRPIPWTSWQRSEDYYSEGQLIWLDVDTLLRERSKGRKSLDDFARAFFGVDDGRYEPLTYAFEDVVRTLNQIEPYDWATFLRQRLDGHGPGAPLDGLDRGGYRLVYSDAPTEYFRSAEARRRATDLTYSLGLVLDKTGALSAVQWDGPAFKAGLTIGAQIVAVNGLAYAGDRLKEAVRAAKGSTTPIELIVKKGDAYRVVKIDYHGGLRYPRLERVAGKAALLDDILTPRK
ncbi:peptidase M61 [Caulobacter sp. CCUG 60055]|nr:M61 family metallopeptidase [Caulobacteraceae bacterium]MCI3180893.1 peptidase M61 [Caulobacter sp. CCUG 60055]